MHMVAASGNVEKTYEVFTQAVEKHYNPVIPPFVLPLLTSIRRSSKAPEYFISHFMPWMKKYLPELPNMEAKTQRLLVEFFTDLLSHERFQGDPDLYKLLGDLFLQVWQIHSKQLVKGNKAATPDAKVFLQKLMFSSVPKTYGIGLLTNGLNV